MKSMHVTVSPSGAMTLPEDLRQQLGVENGGTLLVWEEDGRFIFDTAESRVARARAIIQQYIPPGTRLVDEFIAEKRGEAERE